MFEGVLGRQATRRGFLQIPHKIAALHLANQLANPAVEQLVNLVTAAGISVSSRLNTGGRKLTAVPSPLALGNEARQERVEAVSTKDWPEIPLIADGYFHWSYIDNQFQQPNNFGLEAVCYVASNSDLMIIGAVFNPSKVKMSDKSYALGSNEAISMGFQRLGEEFVPKINKKEMDLEGVMVDSEGFKESAKIFFKQVGEVEKQLGVPGNSSIVAWVKRPPMNERLVLVFEQGLVDLVQPNGRIEPSPLANLTFKFKIIQPKTPAPREIQPS